MSVTVQSLNGLVDLAFEKRRPASGARLAEIARAADYKIVATTINHIRAGTYRPQPGKQTLEALAFLAGVPTAVAYEAAGLPVPGKPFAEELDRKSTRLNSSHLAVSRMPSSA